MRWSGCGALWCAEHVVETDYEDLPESATAATRTFLLDTLRSGGGGKRGVLDATSARKGGRHESCEAGRPVSPHRRMRLVQ